MIMNKKDKSISKFLLPYITLNYNVLLPALDINEQIQACIMSLTTEELAESLKKYENKSKQIALELLKDQDIIDYLEELPFKDDDKIVVYGDSSSAEKGGWVDVLKYIIEIGTEKDIELINSSVSGLTSTSLLQSLGNRVLSHNPNWVILNFGTWDAFRVNYAADRPLVSLTEFWENLQSIRTAIESLVSPNPIIWMSPSSVNEEATNINPLFNGSFSNSEIRAYQEVMRDKGGIIIDPYFQRFGNTPENWYYAADGIHYSESGNLETVKTILKTLATVKNE